MLSSSMNKYMNELMKLSNIHLNDYFNWQPGRSKRRELRFLANKSDAFFVKVILDTETFAQRLRYFKVV